MDIAEIAEIAEIADIAKAEISRNSIKKHRNN